MYDNKIVYYLNEPYLEYDKNDKKSKQWIEWRRNDDEPTVWIERIEQIDSKIIKLILENGEQILLNV